MERQPICKTFPSGSKAWLLDGKYHRTDGPACEYPDGTKEWYLHGKLHRTDGPAVEWADGTKEWFLDDKLHRTDGPAIECSDGSKAWFLDGKKVPWQMVYHQTITDEARLSILIAALTTS